MPAIIDQKICTCAPRCFAAPACPNDAIAFRVELGQVTIESDLCGECPGPCTNFCDPSAIKYTPNPDDLDLLEAQIAGTMTAEQIALERVKRKQEAARQAEEAKASPVVALTAKTFEQTVRATALPIVIDFWADWCGPCKQMAPIFEQLAQQYAGQMLFAKVDTDKEQALAATLGVRSLPTLLFIYAGQVIDGVVGAVPAPQLQTRIRQVLAAVAQLTGGQPPAGPGQPPAGPGTPPAGPGTPPPGPGRGPAGGPARGPGGLPGGPPPSAGPGGPARPPKPTIILPGRY